MTEHRYIAGDPWAICDRCGFKYRRSELRKEWTGLLVCKADFDPKHPQLTGPRVPADRIAVRDARPRPEESHQVAVTATTLAAAAVAGATSITVADSTGMAVGHNIQVFDDEGTAVWTTIATLPGADVVTVPTGLLAAAASGNVVNWTSTLNRVTVGSL